MNIEEYIQSGIIESFVLGECSEEQSREVIALAGKHPEIQAEIEAIENALINLAADSYTAKPSTKEKLFASITADAIENSTNETLKEQNGKMVALNPQRRSPFTVYLAAASIALIVSVAFNVFYYSQLKKTETALLALSNEKQEFATVLASERSNIAALKNQIQDISSQDVVQVKLAGLKLIPDANAMIYYNTKNRQVYLHIGQLPTAPENKQYQLWAIVDGKPVDAGVFDAASSDSAFIKMKDSLPASAFAVTIEKKGGSINPSLEQMVLLGSI